MNAQSKLPNDMPSVQDGAAQRTGPQAVGFVDALGSRQLVFDPATSTSVEVLRFRPEFSESPEFEGALLARVEALSHTRHVSLAAIHSVERISDTELALLSKQTPGRRVSELLPRAHGPAFALELIRLVTPALAALQRSGDDVAHGALAPERIVVTRDGRLVMVEHVVGAAIEALKLSKDKLNELGIVVPASAPEPVQFTPRTDMAQLGFIALSLLLGRKLDAADYPARVPALLDEFSRTGSPVLVAKLRSWLERAMQLSPRSFASAREAQAALGELPDDSDVQAANVINSLDAFPQEATTPPQPAKPQAHSNQQANPQVDAAARVEAPVDRRGPVADRRASGRRGIGTWIIAGLGLLAVAEGVALFVMPYLRPPVEQIDVRPPQTAVPETIAPPVTPAPTPVAAESSTVTTPIGSPGPTAPAATSPIQNASQASIPAAGAVAGAANGATPATTPVPAGPRFGGLTVKSPMELQVFENGALIGSTASPIAVNEGTRSVEFVNEATGFKFRQNVTVKGGQMTTVNIAVPNGKVSINAAPWAEVDIDGKSAGETPLANLSLPIGTHEITFRHPQFGTKKQTIVVKVDGITKVNHAFQQESSR